MKTLVMKKLICSFLVFVLSSLVAEYCDAQNFETDTIKFQTSGYTDLQDSSLVSAESEFIWYKGDYIKWNQEGGAVVYMIDITGSSPLTLPASVGETLSTEVSMAGGITGSFAISRLEAGIVIFLTLNGGTTPIQVRYSVSSINIL